MVIRPAGVVKQDESPKSPEVVFVEVAFSQTVNCDCSVLGDAPGGGVSHRRDPRTKFSRVSVPGSIAQQWIPGQKGDARDDGSGPVVPLDDMERADVKRAPSVGTVLDPMSPRQSENMLRVDGEPLATG